MSKKIAALIAAVLSTACVGIAILAIGGAALFNPNGTVAAQSPAQAATQTTSSTDVSNQSQVQQLQALVAQYQARDQQYQQQLQDASNQVQQAQQQMAEIQQLLTALQERGLITIAQDGRIFINGH